MADEQLIVVAKRLLTDIRDFRTLLHRTYRSGSKQVTSADLRQTASVLVETWIRDLSQRPEIAACVAENHLGDLNVHFQRILLFTEKATLRSRYDKEIAGILKNYTANLVLPLMQSGPKTPLPVTSGSPSNVSQSTTGQIAAEGFRATAFIGHSFSANDEPLVNAVTAVLEAIGIKVFTGKKPKADQISEKVKGLIDGQHMFVGVFTRRDRLAGKQEWSTSTWIIDEKAYASRSKKLILLKEAGVESIGGIQGDYEYIEFSRDKFELAIISLLQLFNVTVGGLQ